MGVEAAGIRLGSACRPIMAWPTPVVVDLEAAMLDRCVAQSVLAAALRRHPVEAAAALLRHGGNPDRAAAAIAAALPDLPVTVAVDPALVDALHTHQRLGGSLAILGRAHPAGARAVARTLGLKARLILPAAVDRSLDNRLADALTTIYGRGGFSYVGGRRSGDTLPLLAERVILVGGSPAQRRRLRALGTPAVLMARQTKRRRIIAAGSLFPDACERRHANAPHAMPFRPAG